MEYQSILNRIEEQKKDEGLSAKLYRYAGLIHAIEFFSQKLNFDQIIDAAFDFINELLTLERSAIFVMSGNNYILKKSKGNSNEISVIKEGKGLQDLAVLHGGLLYDEEHHLRFFEKSVLEAYGVTITVPLIIESSLYGFIFISSKMVGELNSDDYIISEALMKLFNNALENYRRFEEIQEANRELDEKIFNLFAINQSSKALLSELSLDVLYNLSVDVFSELTQSSVTGFILYDERSEEYRLKAYKNVFDREKEILVSLSLNKLARVDGNRVIIDVTKETDVVYFNHIFKEGLEALRDLQVQYIVMLVKSGKVLGLVTLGKTVTGIHYKASIFELIESMASATYIALSNSQLFRQVNEQKKLIQRKLENLISLNNLMKNINSSSRAEVLLEMTLKTLDVSFGVEKALIALLDTEKNVFRIANKLNVETDHEEIEINENWKRVLEGDTVYEAREEGVVQFIGESLEKEIGAASGILIVPIYIDSLDAEILGVVVIFKYRKTLLNDEESMLTTETICNHIAPVLKNLFTIEEQKRFLLPNHIELFKRDLKQEVSDALEFSLDLSVVQVVDERDFVFKGSTIIDKLKENFKKVYPFSYNNIFLIVNDVDREIEAKIKEAAGLECIKVKTVALGRDFGNFQEFFKLF